MGAFSIGETGDLVIARICIVGLVLTGLSAAQETGGKDPAAILELGGAASAGLDGSGSYGPDVAIEFTPIEHWLEIEAGVSPLFARHRPAEWNVDLLFKKPWTLSPKAEFMLGVGPEWVHSREAGRGVNTVAGEIAADFMFWPGSRHKFGWFVEPAFEYNFGRGHERSFGVSAGLLIAIP